jgi:hypothetical protein
MKKLLSVMLSLTLLFAVSLPESASAATYVNATDSEFSGTTNGNFRYEGTDEYVTIPDTIKGVKVTSYNFMFANAKYVKGVKASNPNVISAAGMFSNHKSDSLTVDIDTSSVKNMVAMFEGSTTKSITFGDAFDTGACENMSLMFAWTGMTTLNLNFDTKNVESMYSMFQASKVANLSLNFTNTAKVEQMDYMFCESQVHTLDLGKFQFRKGAVIDFMFDDASTVIVYVQSQAYADRLNATIKPDSLVAIVK